MEEKGSSFSLFTPKPSRRFSSFDIAFAVFSYMSRRWRTDDYGKFHSDQWGDFKTFIRFHVEDDKITKLEVGETE
ncbi:MAG: hypothetical protein ACJ71P_05315 [Nitrososphaeraceae archaeon]